MATSMPPPPLATISLCMWIHSILWVGLGREGYLTCKLNEGMEREVKNSNCVAEKIKNIFKNPVPFVVSVFKLKQQRFMLKLL